VTAGTHNDLLSIGRRRSNSCSCSHTPEEAAAQHGGPSISLLRPELQQQWNHVNNLHLGNIIIKPCCNLNVWWPCDQCPCGLAHEWVARVADRERMHYRCPFCTNKRLCHHNALSTVAPSVAAYWDTARNGLGPDQVTAHSSIKRHWHCQKCGYRWQAVVCSKVRGNSGCPKCSHQSQTKCKQPTLTESNHPVMLEFDHDRNRKAGLDPDKLTLGSGIPVHWVCHKCPRGQLHRFKASPNRRFGMGRNCPYCSSKKVCLCNSLQGCFPALAEEWDSAKNGLEADQVIAQSHTISHKGFLEGQRGAYLGATTLQTCRRSESKGQKGVLHIKACAETVSNRAWQS